MATYSEYRDREDAIRRARKIFVATGLTNNITHAFAAYQYIISESERPITVNASWYRGFAGNVMDTLERPLCPDCGEPLFFRNVRPNEEGIKCQLVCSNSECDTVLNSEHSIDWWQATLPKRST
jgi:hypothetical protein